MLGPLLARLELLASLPFLGDLHEQLERSTGVGDDAVVRHEHAADLRRLDIDVHEFAALGVDLHGAGMTIGPAVANAQHKIGLEHGGVAVAVAGLQPNHADHQRVIVGNRAPAHKRGDHRNAGDLGEFHQERRCVGIDDAATGDDERALGCIEHGQRFFDLRARRLGFVDRQRFIGLVVEFDFRHLHVEGQVDQHRPGTARAHEVKRLLERPRHLGGLAHGHRPLGERLGDRLDVHRLEVFLV